MLKLMPWEKEVECPECGGFGECEYEYGMPDPMAWRGGELQDCTEECHECQGRGVVIVEREESEYA